MDTYERGGSGWYWDCSKTIKATDATTKMFRRLEEGIHMGAMVDEFLIQQQHQYGGLLTTASYSGGFHIEENVDNDKND